MHLSICPKIGFHFFAMKYLDCILFSTGRAASTAIYQYLNFAGPLGLPELKEPHYWCDIQSYKRTYDLIDSIYISNEDDYWGLYADSKISLDASCGYFFYLDDVIKNLGSSEQKPRVIFLYREPLSRAKSWFNERKKKKLTNAVDIFEDMAQVPEQGLWWEHYYDNVLYFTGYKKLQESFDQVMTVNYDYFAKHPLATISALFDYLEVKPMALGSLEFEPVNSSREAVAISFFREHPILKQLANRVPTAVRRWGRHQYLGFGRSFRHQKQLCKFQDINRIKDFLPNNIAEYERFREYIRHKDLYFYSSTL